MSTFSAGAITGTLGLDASEFSEATRESTSLAGIFAESIGQILTAATGSPLLGELANGISEVVAAAGSGDWGEAFAASIHTASGAVTGFIEVLKGEAESMHEFGLAAERAGVSVEWMSSFGRAAEAYGVQTEQLTMAMQFLQRSASDVTSGDSTFKSQADAFRDLGISSEFLKEHLNDSQAIFTEVITKLGGLSNSSDQTRIAMELLSRGGKELAPIFKDGGKGANDLAEQITQLGGGFTEQDAAMGLSIGKLGAEFSAAIDGMEKAATKPILKVLMDNSQRLLGDFKAAGEWAANTLPGIINAAIPLIEKAGAAVEALGDAIADLTSGKPVDAAGDTMTEATAKQETRNKLGSFFGDIAIGLTTSENITAGRLWHDIWSPNDDGTYPTDANALPRQQMTGPTRGAAPPAQGSTSTLNLNITDTTPTGKAAQIAAAVAQHLQRDAARQQADAQRAARVAAEATP